MGITIQIISVVIQIPIPRHRIKGCVETSSVHAQFRICSLRVRFQSPESNFPSYGSVANQVRSRLFGIWNNPPKAIQGFVERMRQHIQPAQLVFTT